MSLVLSTLDKGHWIALVAGLFLVCEADISAQGKLRGPGMAGGTPQLPPKPPINLLNNGTLATWPNPNATLPNQLQFAYIAAVPLGDRLGYNGVFYDQEIIPNVGLFAPGAMGGMMPSGPSPFPPPFPPPLFKAAMLARQRMVVMQAQRMRMMAGQSYLYRPTAQFAPPAGAYGGNERNPTSPPGFSTYGTGIGGLATSSFSSPFGAGFQ